MICPRPAYNEESRLFGTAVKSMKGAGMRQKVRRYLNSRAKTKRLQGKPEKMKNIRLAVFLCFVAGIFCANFIDQEQLGSFGIWNAYFIEKFKYTRIQSPELFYYVLEKRLPLFCLLLLCIMTNWGMAAGTIFLSWQGFAAGFFITASVVAYGLKGLLLTGAAVIPQYIFYIPIYISYLYLAAFWKGKDKEREGGVGKKKIREYLLFAALCLGMISVYLAGIFLESYVNPSLLKNILKFF